MKFIRSSCTLNLLIVSALVLSACGGNSTNTAASKTSAAPQVAVNCGGKKKLKASGATAQQNAMEQFVYAYVHACRGYTLDYNANSSGAGVTDFINNVSDLAGSGEPLNPAKGQPERAAQRCGSRALNLPTVFEPIVVTYHLTGVDTLNLDAPTLARIFNGGITRWDDPAITALNSAATLPSIPIRVIFRTDQSANSTNFQQYLIAASNGAWGKGASQKFQGGVGEGAEGDNGSSAAVLNIEGAITYNEWSFGVGRRLSMAQIITPADRNPVPITTEAFTKTVAKARISDDDGDLRVDTSSFYTPTEPGAYPIMEVTYEIVCSKYPDPATGAAVKAFMQAAVGAGQLDLDEFGSIPLPSSIQSKLVTVVNTIS